MNGCSGDNSTIITKPDLTSLSLLTCSRKQRTSCAAKAKVPQVVGVRTIRGERVDIGQIQSRYSTVSEIFAGNEFSVSVFWGEHPECPGAPVWQFIKSFKTEC